MEETKSGNLLDAMFEEMNRVRELIQEYKSIPGEAGMIGAALLKINIQDAERAISSNDVAQMLLCYEHLKSCE